ncbi:MAG: Cell filamentation protein Fic [uncultured Sulfurovum sp.]|uniref:Cell filamentation protein Fic n=1 Tax=uncultured Sulfurovum sp. TaxID=269237 RepID=A0A6S6TV59_9BACT|nr:MAG: Cell filamentation protein Fic [uncultured Sulfurovum sp.]
MLEDTTRALGELNAFTMIVPNVDIFIQMHITKEANTSSKIEGTKTEIDQVIVTKEQIDPEKRDDEKRRQSPPQTTLTPPSPKPSYHQRPPQRLRYAYNLFSEPLKHRLFLLSVLQHLLTLFLCSLLQTHLWF